MGFPLHKPYLYSLYRWGFLRFRYLKVFGDIVRETISIMMMKIGMVTFMIVHNNNTKNTHMMIITAATTTTPPTTTRVFFLVVVIEFKSNKDCDHSKIYMIYTSYPFIHNPNKTPMTDRSLATFLGRSAHDNHCYYHCVLHLRKLFPMHWLDPGYAEELWLDFGKAEEWPKDEVSLTDMRDYVVWYTPLED